MVKTRFISAALLLFLWMATPALRCVLPSESLTQEEQACCKAMGGNCGDMGNHSCCKKIQRSQAAVAVKNARAPRDAALATLSITPAIFSVPQSVTAEIIPAPSPPLPIVGTSVLRI